MTEGIVFDIQRYSLQDGPGLRTLVFLKGCPLRCQWCSNPESQRREPQMLYDAERCTLCGDCVRVCPNDAIRVEAEGLCYRESACDMCGACVSACTHQARTIVGKVASVSDVLTSVMRDAPFYRRSGGGVTLGGGEPTYQPAFAREMLRQLRSKGVDTAIETCGFAPVDGFMAVAELADHVLFDIKHAESRRHAELTGMGNELIVDNLDALLHRQADVMLRYPLIPGRNDGADDLHALCALVRRLPRIPPVELVPYHRLGEHKYRLLGRDYALAGVPPYADDEVNRICESLSASGIACSIVSH